MPKRSLSIAGRQLTLGARPDRLDLRDLPYRPPAASLDPIYPTDEQVTDLLPKYLTAGLILDQESEGACTGFGLAAVVNFLLWVRSTHRMCGTEKVSPRMLYHLARFYDEWPGEDYEGSSCRGALKGWHRHGVCIDSLRPYRDAKGAHFIRPQDGWDTDALARPLGVYYRIDRQSVVDIQAAIFHTGAVYVSANVHSGWDVKTMTGAPTHKTLPVIEASAKVEGGHAFALVGYNDIGFVAQNSWGPTWGASGFAILPYEDWVANGTDAWVVALGAPVSRGVRGQMRGKGSASPQRFVLSRERGPGRVGGQSWLGAAPDPLEGRKGAWSEQEAYWHTLVTGNDGGIINRLPQVANDHDNAVWVCREQPHKWFEEQTAGDPWRLVIYAHGGLNAEGASIERIRMLGPCFQENGIYPVFTTWKSGWQETLGGILADGVNKLFGGQPVPTRGLSDALAEVSDRALEVFIRGVLVKSLWSELKENVARSSDSGHGLDLLADRLAALATDAQGKLEVHLIGHSAGSFVCGGLLSELRQRNIVVKTCTLYTPACDLRFALDYFRPAIEGNQLPRAELWLHVLSDRREQDDSVGPYRKSLLYLVSRALERWHKTPLLGLANAFDASCATNAYWHSDTVADVQAWQRFFWNNAVPVEFAATGSPAPQGTLFMLADAQVSVGPRRIQSSHGCFDNSIAIITETLRTILKRDPTRKITDLDY